MFRIGEFALLTGISIHMLRNYDKIGLLVPKCVGIDNNYRYYSEDQIIAANRIQILKGLGFGLKEIFKISDCTDNDVLELIENKIIEKQREAEHIEKQLQRMRQAVIELDVYGKLVFSVNIKTLVSRKMVSLRAGIRKFEDEGLLWERLDNECTANGIKTLSAEYSYAITHSIDNKNMLIDTEVLRPVSKIPAKKVNLKFYEISEMEAAVVSFKGLYSKISDISAYVCKFIQGTDYEICGVPLRKYFLSPENETNPQNYITEYIFPLKNIIKTP